MATHQLRSVTEPLGENRASLRCCQPLLLVIQPGFMQTERGVSRKDKVRTDTRLVRPATRCRMQGLSSRAHAFSVEALVGKPCKRMKVSERLGSSSDGGADGTVCTGQRSTNQAQQAGSALRRPEDTSSEPPGQTDRPASEDSEPACEDSDCRSDGEARVELQGSELWKRFYEIGTEMIITKAGRRMFPSVRVKVRNLEPCQQYYIAMDVMPVDSKRYRYVYHSSQWMVAGNTDHSCISPRLYVHPDSPCTGETWMRQVISFDRVKLTNNEMDDKGHIILQSMHKYKPRVHVIRHDPRMDLSQIRSLPAEGVHSFSFLETEFTTVTAYQNQQITKLKIDRNPFAKGFRDPGRNSVCLWMQGGSGWPAGVLPLERPSQLGLEAFRAPAPRQFGFGQHEEPFPSSLISGPPPTLWFLLPGRCPSHPRSSALRQSFCHRRFHTRRRGLPPKRRETEELSPAASSLRPPAPLDAPGEETSSSQASGEPSPSLQLPLPP
ncbi:T-box transcription factor TBX22 isoform X2 [Oryzias latipes]